MVFVTKKLLNTQGHKYVRERERGIKQRRSGNRQNTFAFLQYLKKTKSTIRV